jgi:glucose-6-phosphate 1-epimerase
MPDARGSAGPAERTRAAPPAPLPVVTLTATDGATADIHRHGAHVTSWRPSPDGEERLFLSSRSEIGTGAAIRGGIPVIFPQFGAEGDLPRHGFARTMHWGVGGIGRTGGGMAEADFVLRDTPETRAVWDAAFIAVITVRIVERWLAVTLSVENVGEHRFSFTAALHTYLLTHDIGDVELIGLLGTSYRHGPECLVTVDRDERLRVTGEIDRVYFDAPSRLELREGSRSLLIDSLGFPDAVVWNPGPERVATMYDMAPGDDRRMLCVEAAVVKKPIVLEPRRRWMGTQTLTAR